MLAEQAANLGISSSVHLVGAVDHEALVAYYQKADVFCLPSYSEGFPCAVVEAMACGKPVVASDVGGVGEVVDDQSGILVTAGDVEALSNAILHVKNRTWDAEGIRRKIVAGFTWPLWTTSMLVLIDSVIMKSDSSPQNIVNQENFK
jgi:glycosyltransferase involved in cell wall biosynthesis